MNRREFITGSRPKRSASLGVEYYTNAVLRNQDNEEVRFYDDCIKDKIAVITHFYTRCRGACPISTANLVRVQEALGDRLGRDIFMYSITLKPWEDDPAALKEYARRHGAKRGWIFLTGDQYDLDTIRYRLFRWDLPALDQNLDQHTGMVRIINDSIDRWSMCPTFATPRQIVQAIYWAEPTKPYEERLRLNIARQAEIDAELRHAAVAR